MIGTGLLGALTGGIMPMAKMIMEFKDRKPKRQHELDMLEREERIADKERQLKIVETNIDVARIAQDGLASARKHDALKYLTPAMLDGCSPVVRNIIVLALTIVDWMRGLVRPTVTFILVGAVVADYMAHRYGGPGIMEGASQIVVMELTGVAVSFWFGEKIRLK